MGSKTIGDQKQGQAKTKDVRTKFKNEKHFRIMTESKIQGESYKWFNNNFCLKFHDPRGIMWSIPNEAASVVAGILKMFGVSKYKIKNIQIRINQKLKSMGLLSGVADTDIILPNGVRFFVEFKTPSGRQSKKQKEFQKRVEDLGHEYFVIRSVDEFKNLIQSKI